MASKADGNANVETWMPQNKGERITGQVIGRKEIVRSDPQPGQTPSYFMFTILTDSGKAYQVHAGCATLDREFKRVKPAPKQVITIEFQGVGGTKKFPNSKTPFYEINPDENTSWGWDSDSDDDDPDF